MKDTDPHNSQHGWTINDGPGNPNCKFSQLHQYYQMHSSKLDYCYYGRRIWSDLAYQIDISIHDLTNTSPAGNQGGLIWRLDSTSDTYYYLSITYNGDYELFLVQHDHAISLRSGSSQHINKWMTTPVWNTLLVIAQGSTLTIFINNHYVDTVSDTRLTQGAIGVAVSSPQNHYSLAQYRNAEVWVST